MPSPLFRNYERHLRKTAVRQFRSTDLGKIVGEIDSAVRGKTTKAKMQRIADLGNRLTPGKLFDELEKTDSTAQLAGEIAKYAGGAIRDRALNALFDMAGPVGHLLKALFRPFGKKVTRVERELQAAANLLQAFGFGVTSKPVSRKPKRGERGKTKEQQAKELLEELGYEVIAPGESRQQERPSQLDEGPLPPVPLDQAGRFATLEFDGRTRRVPINDPIITGEMVRVEGSSNVHSIGIQVDPSGRGNRHELYVRFLDNRDGQRVGPGPLYVYYGVPIEVWDAFMMARSKGTFIWDQIRIRGTVSGHRYQYDLKGISRGYVPRRAKLIGNDEWFVKRTFKTQIQTRESQLDDELVRRGRPNRGAPNRGGPNRGTPNRGR